MDKVVKIYTDGACSGNPGMGGWGAVIIFESRTEELSGREDYTTNNKMELQAVIQGLKALKTPREIVVYTDSNYVKQGITAWIIRWKQNGWKTSNKQPVKNKEMWEELDLEVSRHESIKWVWVKGHAGDHYNELADNLARDAIHS